MGYDNLTSSDSGYNDINKFMNSEECDDLDRIFIDDFLSNKKNVKNMKLIADEYYEGKKYPGYPNHCVKYKLFQAFEKIYNNM